MADTVAVMNAGVIEQMGAPMDLYEHPRTTFVANFLGQSNLIKGRVTGTESGRLVIGVESATLRVPRVRAVASEGEVWVGIRPEKVFLAEPGAEDDDANVIRGGVVSDVSFIGVSTQYLVRMPWGQELMAFEQNTGARRQFAPGERVDLHWMPDHTFVLDADQDAAAGVDLQDES